MKILKNYKSMIILLGFILIQALSKKLGGRTSYDSTRVLYS